jgi:chemotaxis signal transduction protein
MSAMSGAERDILHVQEIRGYEQPTRLAGAPEFIRGVLNLDPWFDSLTVTVVLKAGGRVVGAVVDSVSDVISQVVETMKGINDSSKKIADIIRVIDGLAPGMT